MACTMKSGQKLGCQEAGKAKTCVCDKSGCDPSSALTIHANTWLITIIGILSMVYHLGWIKMD